MPARARVPNAASQLSRLAYPAAVAGNSRTPSSPPTGSSAAATCVSAWVSTPPVMARVSTMVNAISDTRMVLSRARGSEPRPVSAGSGRGGGRGSGGWLEADLVAEGFEFRDQAPGFPVGVQAAGEVVGAELVVGSGGGQDVPDDHQQGVGDHDDGFLFRGRAAVAAPFHDVPVVEGLEVAVVADGGPGGFDQDGLQVGVAVAAPAGAAFAGGFVVARAQAGPGGQAGGVGEVLGDAGPDLGDGRRSGLPAPSPGPGS